MSFWSEQSMGASNRVVTGLSYRPPRLHRLAGWYDNLGSYSVTSHHIHMCSFELRRSTRELASRLRWTGKVLYSIRPSSYASTPSSLPPSLSLSFSFIYYPSYTPCWAIKPVMVYQVPTVLYSRVTGAKKARKHKQFREISQKRWTFREISIYEIYFHGIHCSKCKLLLQAILLYSFGVQFTVHTFCTLQSTRTNNTEFTLWDSRWKFPSGSWDQILSRWLEDIVD
jgi:hypothetical protein